ncbi:MAG: sodium/proline symporter [Eubacteriales bacterium]
MTQTLISITIFAYLGVVLSIGYFFSKRNRSANEFYLGGRSLGPFVTAMSAEASDMSSWLLMGLPGVAYVSGLADPFWTALGLGIGTYLNWKIVALRLRRFSHTLNAITIPAFFSQRYADHKHQLSGLSALIIIVFFIPYTASAFAACGKLFSTIFDIDYTTAMLFSALIILVYTVSGGFMAVSFTDMIQSIVMSFALFFVLSYVVTTVGGMGNIFDTIASYDGFFSLFQSHETGPVVEEIIGTGNPYTMLSVISTLAWGLGYFGMPHILLRFMAIEDERKLPIARHVAVIWVVISMILAIFIGIAGRVMTHLAYMDNLEDSETIIIQLAGLLAEYNAQYAIIGGLILAGILAATMSTADSQLLVASSSVSQNLISEYWGKNLSAEMGLLVARISIVIISIIAMFLAADPNSSVFGIVSFAWAGFGASFGPVMLLSLFWRRGNKEGAIAGMLCGGAMVFLWKYQIAPLGGVFAIYELLPAFLTGLLAMVVVSCMTPPPNHEVELIFDASMMPVPPPRHEKTPWFSLLTDKKKKD